MTNKRKSQFRTMPSDFRGGGPVRFMAAAEGNVMVRRPGCVPFVVSTKEWDSWEEVKELQP